MDAKCRYQLGNVPDMFIDSGPSDEPTRCVNAEACSPEGRVDLDSNPAANCS